MGFAKPLAETPPPSHPAEHNLEIEGAETLQKIFSNPFGGGDGTVPWMKWNEAVLSCYRPLTIGTVVSQESFRVHESI